jgi:hypothetical protein
MLCEMNAFIRASAASAAANACGLAVQEEEFAKQLRLARYLAAGGSPPSRPVETVRQPRTRKQERPVVKGGPKPRRKRLPRKLGRKNWRKKGGVQDGRFTRCRHPVQAEGRSSGLRPVVRSAMVSFPSIQAEVYYELSGVSASMDISE